MVRVVFATLETLGAVRECRINGTSCSFRALDSHEHHYFYECVSSDYPREIEVIYAGYRLIGYLSEDDCDWNHVRDLRRYLHMEVEPIESCKSQSVKLMVAPIAGNVTDRFLHVTWDIMLGESSMPGNILSLCVTAERIERERLP